MGPVAMAVALVVASLLLLFTVAISERKKVDAVEAAIQQLMDETLKALLPQDVGQKLGCLPDDNDNHHSDKDKQQNKNKAKEKEKEATKGPKQQPNLKDKAEAQPEKLRQPSGDGDAGDGGAVATKAKK